jgi:putative DNA primase/helicase
VELLPEGYDQESMIYTNSGGPRIEDLGLEKGNELLLSKLEEFCFREDDRERATAVAIAAMLTLFVFNIIPQGTLRPGFLYTANAEGGGKTLLARLAIIPRVGFTPIGNLPEQEEEIEKRITAAAMAGAPTLFFDNGKRHISSGSLERAITATNLEGRILGKSQSYQIENMMTVFLTGNGATISGDLRRRVLHVDLFLREAMAEDRQIQNPLDEAEICASEPRSSLPSGALA